MGDGGKAERWWDGEDARAVEQTSVIIWSCVYVNGLRGLCSVTRGLNLTLCDDRRVWRADRMPGPPLPGRRSEQIQPKLQTQARSSFVAARFNQSPFKEQPVFVKAKCHLRRSSFIFLKLDHMRRYSVWLINVAVLHNRISISSKFGDFRARPCRWNSLNPGWKCQKCSHQTEAT